jgi:activating signal cointegrator complex subunit 2
MTTATLASLPPYPSSHARSQLSHSQLLSLNQKISLSIQHILDFPPQALDSAAPVPFISSYVRDNAQNDLDALIWDAYPKPKPRTESTEARSIRTRTLLLAERLASTGVLDPVTLLDLSIVYASHPTRLRTLFKTAFSSSPSILSSITTSALPAFTSVLLSQTTIGLHGLRKAAHAILCLLRVAPPDLLRAFAHSKEFMLALAQAYDAGLGTATISYGRLYLPAADAPKRDPDDWEFLFLQTKADLLDAFHNVLTALLNTLTGLTPADPSRPLTIEAQHAFDIISALQALPTPPRRPDDQTQPTAFLNRSLLADYQYAYNLSEALTRALPHGAVTDNARLEWLSAALRELDADLNGESSQPSAAGRPRHRDPGAFRLLLGSGAHHDINDLGQDGTARTTEGTTATPFGGSEVATAASSGAVDPRVEEVRAILPDYAPEYIQALLLRSEYGNVERVVEALLEGTAPPPEAIQQQAALKKAQTPQAPEAFEYTRDRRNVFDGEDMDASRMRIGKKRFLVLLSHLPICLMMWSGGAWAVTTRWRYSTTAHS